jgi:hypothetical protein
MTYKQWIIAAVLLAGPTALGGYVLFPNHVMPPELYPDYNPWGNLHGLEGGLLDVMVFSDSVSDDSLEGGFIFEGLDSTIIADDAYRSFDSNGNWVYSDYNSELIERIKKVFGFTDSQVRKLLEGDTPKVPEPATLSLVGLGALALLRKRK